MCANLELSRIDAVVVVRAALREILAGLQDYLDEEDRLGVRGLPSGEGHEVVHDPVREAGAPLDLGELGSALR